MAGFIVFKKLTFEETIKNLVDIEKWFRANPARKICRTELFEVRRGYLVEDILKHSQILELVTQPVTKKGKE